MYVRIYQYSIILVKNMGTAVHNIRLNPNGALTHDRIHTRRFYSSIS